MSAMSGGGLAVAFLVPVVIGAGIVGARWLAGKAMDRIEAHAAEDERADVLRQAQDERGADAGVSMVPFGELPESQVRVVMARRALVIDANDFEGRN